jgi:hypothetical protein
MQPGPAGKLAEQAAPIGSTAVKGDMPSAFVGARSSICAELFMHRQPSAQALISGRRHGSLSDRQVSRDLLPDPRDMRWTDRR